MSDRVNGFTVVLDQNYKDEDAQRIQEAISLLKGVISVTPSVVSVGDLLVREQVKYEYRQKLIRLFADEGNR